MRFFNVHLQFAFPSIFCPAMNADVLSMSGVCGHVGSQVLRHFEAFRTDRTHMFLFVAVHRLLMACQCRCGHESVRTIFTFELPDALMAIGVDFQAVTGIISFLTYAALVILLFQMHRPMMLGQIVARAERFAAHIA